MTIKLEKDNDRWSRATKTEKKRERGGKKIGERRLSFQWSSALTSPARLADLTHSTWNSNNKEGKKQKKHGRKISALRIFLAFLDDKKERHKENEKKKKNWRNKIKLDGS